MANIGNFDEGYR